MRLKALRFIYSVGPHLTFGQEKTERQTPVNMINDDIFHWFFKNALLSNPDCDMVTSAWKT